MRVHMIRAVLRIVDPNKTEQVKNYGEWGRVELTTLTKEFFMQRFRERGLKWALAPGALVKHLRWGVGRIPMSRGITLSSRCSAGRGITCGCRSCWCR